MRTNFTLLLVMLLFATSMVGTAFAGKTIYVDADATGGNNGSSWTDAYICLQDAFAAAQFSDQIWVAAGTYKPDQGVGITPGDRTAAFQLKNGVTIKGGYAGFGEPDPNARDVDEYKTILTGDLAGNDGANFANNDENSYHVVTGKTAATLDAFTISGGNANGSEPNNCGGGMYNTTTLTVSNCTFRNNFADVYGGGIYNSGSPSLTNCTFLGNYSGYGGGMYETGGATLTNCTFSGNTAHHGGGIYMFYYTSPHLIGCTFSDNVANSAGGAMYVYYSAYPTIANCTFRRNSSEKGGAVYNSYEGYPRFVNCTFAGNTGNRDGGAIYSGDGTKVEVVNCTFTGNLAQRGRAVAGEYNGYITEVQIMNSIIWDGGSEIWVNDERSKVIVSYTDVQGGYAGEGNIDSDPCFVDADGPDNILATEDDNLHLRGRSPCIDAGDNNSVPFDKLDLDGDGNTVERLPLDFDWAVRFLDEPSVPDTGNGTAPLVDIGIYEYGTGVCGDAGHPYPKGDLNYDCHVDFADFAEFADNWLVCNAPKCD